MSLADFSEPITASEYAERTGILVTTARQRVAKWCAAGTLFEAGKVLQERGGAPAMRYCADRRLAVLARIATTPRTPPPQTIVREQIPVEVATAKRVTSERFNMITQVGGSRHIPFVPAVIVENEGVSVGVTVEKRMIGAPSNNYWEIVVRLSTPVPPRSDF